MDELIDPHAEIAAELMGSLILFTKTFYKLRTGREFQLSQPTSRESHYITIAKALTKVQRGEIKRLIINVPPRYGKTELSIHFIAWCLAQFQDSNFLYVSYSHTLAAKQTATIRQIVQHPEYQALFGVGLASDTNAKDNFETTQGGSVYGVGAGGSITGRGAGIANVDRFGGAIFIDDIIKPDEALSDTIRDSRNDWYLNTLKSRLNHRETPIIYIGQRTHEDDLAGKLLTGYDGDEWHTVILPALDNHDHALLPQLQNTDDLNKLREKSPYVFASQYQQNPQPAGGGIFKEDWFVCMDETPKMLATFITVDTAETNKAWNDATVFTFMGIYKIENNSIATDELAIHVLNCWEIRVEPHELEAKAIAFISECNLFPVKPKNIYIEKKSTGTTLYSVFTKKLRGLAVIPIEANENKIARFLRAQEFFAAKQVSLPYAKHTRLVIDHMKRITANNTHAHDDIADTLVYGVELALMKKVVPLDSVATEGYHQESIANKFKAYKPVVF